MTKHFELTTALISSFNWLFLQSNSDRDSSVLKDLKLSDGKYLKNKVDGQPVIVAHFLWQYSKSTSLTSGSCSPLSRTSCRWRPLSLWDCSSVHSSSPRVTRRRPNLSSIRSHWRDLPEPGPPENTHTHTAEISQSLQTSNHWDKIQSEARMTRRKLRGERRAWKWETIGNRRGVCVHVCVCVYIGVCVCETERKRARVLHLHVSIYDEKGDVGEHS